MSWDSALVGGGFALGGVARQQLFAIAADRRRLNTERAHRLGDKRSQAFAAVVVAGRRVQRALNDRKQRQPGYEQALAESLDSLTSAAVLVRLLVPPETELVRVMSVFEDKAKHLEHNEDGQAVLALTPLIDEIRRFEGV